MPVPPIAWTQTYAVRILDQRLLPGERVERDLETAHAAADAIRTLAVRGAPLIGIAAAMGLVAGLRAHRHDAREAFLDAQARLTRLLEAARPTAVNLRWALERQRRATLATPGEGEALWQYLRAEASAILAEDALTCRRIGEAGLALVPDGARVLTHCNAGALATAGIGTALAPVYAAHEAGRRVHVFVDETRPLLQGSRLTAWELTERGVPCTVIVDGAAGSLLARRRVDVVLVGADRIVANGDFANKIGTYSLAVLAAHHDVPFYCAAPWSTIDTSMPDGAGIPIEARAPSELGCWEGRACVPAAAEIENPAFDVTPARYVAAYVTERGLLRPPFTS
ncbi:MAG TPA: S-methyl-5-thioribose-1-phosphate isomerase [Gemmatimonadales bacterium]|nr:S-methyl-5-thioribose-1-phosphate isomerase [Gemmatimonadales bacterium]